MRRLRVVLHFSSGTVERAKRARGETPFLAWGDFHAGEELVEEFSLTFRKSSDVNMGCYL